MLKHSVTFIFIAACFAMADGALRGGPENPVANSTAFDTAGAHDTGDEEWHNISSIAQQDISSHARMGSRALATCGSGNRGDGVCTGGRCCSQWGWCGTSSDHCKAANGSGSHGMTSYLDTAKPYLPIFRFDDAAGDYCFPDTKDLAKNDGKCKSFSDTAPVYVRSKQCGKYTVYQFNLWYGKQKGCFLNAGAHGDDNEYVQVWTEGPRGPVKRVRYNQHTGYYFKEAGQAPMEGKRPIVHIGKIAHGAYHVGCDGGSFWEAVVPNAGLDFCAGGCGYWDDFRNSEKGRYVMRNGKLLADPSPREIDCNAPKCTAGHNSWRSLKSSACFGV